MVIKERKRHALAAASSAKKTVFKAAFLSGSNP